MQIERAFGESRLAICGFAFLRAPVLSVRTSSSTCSGNLRCVGVTLLGHPPYNTNQQAPSTSRHLSGKYVAVSTLQLYPGDRIHLKPQLRVVEANCREATRRSVCYYYPTVEPTLYGDALGFVVFKMRLSYSGDALFRAAQATSYLAD